jgi:hypothetical protein
MSGDAIKTFTIDITPKYQVYITSETAVNAEMTTANSITYGGLKKIEDDQLYGKDLTITVPLPTGVITDSAMKIKHTKGSGDSAKTYYYTGEVNSGILTFRNKHGFSDFEIGAEATGVVASMNGVEYTDLQDAVDDAIAEKSFDSTADPVITITGAGSAKVDKDTTIKVKIGNEEAKSIEVKAGKSLTFIDDGNGNITQKDDTTTTPTPTYTSSPSSGGSSSSSSKVSVPTKIDGGSISVSSRNPSKGDTVTITAKPNDGYKVDKITVTDKNGKTVEVTDAGDNKYTFVMPDTTVSISASFAKDDTATDENNNNNPSDTSGIAFTDVKSGDYYYDAVKWAVDNNVTNGLSATSFGPSASCTRAQTVTFMWRAAGSPAPQSVTNPFTDVAQGSYYYDAVMWAVEQGITTGATATTFAPDATVTRAQFVTFEYRAAGSPEVTSDVSFGDVSGSAYYADAVKWAAANGITTGTSANAFSPAASCTRGQTVTFLYRYYAA